MFCPVCGQQQISQETRFCSGCGFLLTGIEQVIANEGNLPYLALPKNSNLPTPRKKGLKQGLMIFLLSFLIVPIISILTIAADKEPYLVAISAILFVVGGLLRMVFALMFESNDPTNVMLEQNSVNTAPNSFGKSPNISALPSKNSIPISTYSPPARSWQETNVIQPLSVTDETTKLLKKED